MERSRVWKFLWLGILSGVVTFCILWGREPTKRQQEVVSSPAAVSDAPTEQTNVREEKATADPLQTEEALHVPVFHVQISPLPTESMAPAPTVPAKEPFSLLWFSDTQVYSYKYPEVFLAMTDWANSVYREYGSLAVVHTGDIVDNHNYARHWIHAENAILRLSGDLPFLCVAGNHDVGASEPDYTQYRAYGFCAVKDEADTYLDGVCWSHEFKAQNLLLVGIGWQTGTEYLDWVRERLLCYPNHTAILLVHSFLTDEGNLTATGKKLEQEILSRHPNVRLVLCGHNDGSALWSKTYEEGQRTVHAMMYNFQDDKKHGLGYVRVLMFHPETRNIAVTTYSPYLDDYNYHKEESKDTFTLKNAF